MSMRAPGSLIGSWRHSAVVLVWVVILVATGTPSAWGQTAPSEPFGQITESSMPGDAADPVPAPPPLTVDEIIERVEAVFDGITDIELIVEVEQYNATDGSVTPGRGRLLALLPDLFRFEWLEPDMLAGSILLVDRAQNEAWQYNPIREEIIVQQWDRLAAQQNLGQNLDRWISLPDQSDYDLAMGDVVYNDHEPYYVVLARPRSDLRQLYEFLVHPETWMISQFRYFDVDGRLALHAHLRDVRVNSGLDEASLRTMPAAIIRHR